MIHTFTSRKIFVIRTHPEELLVLKYISSTPGRLITPPLTTSKFSLSRGVINPQNFFAIGDWGVPPPRPPASPYKHTNYISENTSPLYLQPQNNVENFVTFDNR